MMDMAYVATIQHGRRPYVIQSVRGSAPHTAPLEVLCCKFAAQSIVRADYPATDDCGAGGLGSEFAA